MGLRIRPINVGSCCFPKSYLAGNAPGNEKPFETPHMMFYIDGADKKILVDTGGLPADHERSIKYHDKTYKQTPEQDVATAFKAATSLDPEEVDIVILTHLHWDHCQNNHLFKNAEFFVQIKEIYASINPIPRFGKTYEAFNIGEIPCWALQPTKWNFIDGDTDIYPGIKAFLCPGHSPGTMVLMVETDQGPYLLGSDAFPLYDVVLPDGSLSPSALNNNLEDAWHSAQRMSKIMKECGAKLLPGHDPKVLEHEWYPF